MNLGLAQVGARGKTTLLELNDTPDSYDGQQGKVLAVNAGATGVEFVASGGGAAPAATSILYRRASGNYTTTSPQFVTVDADNIKVTIVPTGTRVLVTATFRGGNNQSLGYSRFTISDGVQYPGGDTVYGLIQSIGTTPIAATITALFTGLTPGQTYVFYLQFNTSNGSYTAYVYGGGNYTVAMTAVEV